MTDYRIVVLQRGWVVVGEYNKKKKEITLENASVIRRWGTTKGLGELAKKGPLSDTILDPCGTVKFHPLTAVMSIETDIKKWQN